MNHSRIEEPSSKLGGVAALCVGSLMLAALAGCSGATDAGETDAMGTPPPMNTGGSASPNTGGGSGSGNGGARTMTGGAPAGGTRGDAPTGGMMTTGGSAAAGGAQAMGGAGSAGGSGGSASGGNSGGSSEPAPKGSMLPKATQPCPTFQDGTMTFLGQSVRVWVGKPTAEQHGPVVVYWYATGSSTQEAERGLGQAAIAEIKAAGGVVLAVAKTNGKGSNTGNGVWYTGDFETTDEAVACAIEQLHVDTRRIHAAGYSAGGLQTAVMAYARSGWLASVATYSGGTSGFGSKTLQDPDAVPSVMCAHGGVGKDTLILDFAKTSLAFEDDIKKRGGFAIDCDDGGSHVSGTRMTTMSGPIWQFMKDHPFGVTPKPYAAGLPASFPAVCTIR